MRIPLAAVIILMCFSVFVFAEDGGFPPPAPNVEVDVLSSLDYGINKIDETIIKTLTITNNGNAPLEISEIVFETNNGIFNIIKETCVEKDIPVNDTCYIGVGFTPTSLGPFEDRLIVNYLSPETSFIEITYSGSGVAGNDFPTKPQLIYPENGQTGVPLSVTFNWKESVDPNGDSVSYELYVCDNEVFYGCDPTPGTPSAKPAEEKIDAISKLGVGLMFFGFLWFGVTDKKKVNIFLILLLLSGTVFTSCLFDEDDDEEPAVVLKDITGTAADLESATKYYWRVIADDGNFGRISSEIWDFTTE